MDGQQTIEQLSVGLNECRLADSIHQRDWILKLPSEQKRREALVLQGWSLSSHFRSLCSRFTLDKFEHGEAPDFILTGGNNHIAVEVTRIVSPKKAIYDESGHHPAGGYTSTLRRSKPTREFHRAIEAGEPPDSSLVFPHFEPSAALESDYNSLATERLAEKAKSVTRYSHLHDHVVILLSDEMSEFQIKVDQRLPRLCAVRSSIEFPSNSEVILVDYKSESSALVREIPKLV
jgi:hypothetical protein